MNTAKGHASSTRERLGSDDLIADAVALLRPRTVVEPPFRARAPWRVGFDPFPHVKLGAVVRGDCWLTLDGHDPVHLQAGDFYLLGNPPRYTLASAPDASCTSQDPFRDSEADASTSLEASASGIYVCGGHFSFDESNAAILLDFLPTLIHVRADAPRGVLLAHLSELLVAEVEARATGGGLVLEHLAQILFVHMLRAGTEQDRPPGGWLGALRKDGIGAALRAMHADVAHRWTLAELAEVSHMSRSAFAGAFKAQVGRAPLDYLIQWRMGLARDELRRDARSITEIAAAIGYESESAFSTAFRRVVGQSPKQFRSVARSTRQPH